MNREAAQSLFFKKISTEHAELIGFTRNHQLTMWLAMNVFTHMLDTHRPKSTKTQCTSKSEKITAEETDIAHFIGGFVVKKLKDRSKDEEQKLLLTLVDKDPANSKTLLAAKSHGRMTNITRDAHWLFVELEQIFRDTFPVGTIDMDLKQYKSNCLSSEVIQNCYFSGTYECEHSTEKETILSKIICLYFKVRVHHEARIVVDKLRAKTKLSSKDKALRSRLAK